MQKFFFARLLAVSLFLISSCSKASDRVKPFDTYQAPAQRSPTGSPTDTLTAFPTQTTVTPEPTLNATATIQASIENGGCIKSFESFAYIFPEERRSVYIHPLPPWEEISSIPSLPEGSWAGGPQVAIARNFNGQSEIWIRRDDFVVFLPPKFDRFREFLIYKSNSKEWQSTSANTKDPDVFIGKLFVTSDNSIWGQNIWPYDYDATQSQKTPILSKYNESTKRFEFAPNTLEIPLEIEGSNSDGIEIVLDTQDVFWIFVKGYGAFSYDTNSFELNKHFHWEDMDITQARLAPDGSIYLKKYFYVREKNEDVLFQFFPKENALVTLKIPDEPWLSIGSMVVDQTGRLWFGATGYRNPDGTWEVINPGYLEYIKNILIGSPLWSPPGVFLESSDSVLWFMSYTDTGPAFQGNAWYDPATGKGCMFTNLPSKIIEDGEKNLWLVSDGNLYKYSLNN